jgi:hypothetical protein
MVAVYYTLNQLMDQEQRALPSASEHNEIYLKEFRRQTMSRLADLLRLAILAGCILEPVGKLPLFYQPYSVSNAQHSRSVDAVDLCGSHQGQSRILHQSLIYMSPILLAQKKSIACQHEPVPFPDAVLWGFARADEGRSASRCQTVQPAG